MTKRIFIGTIQSENFGKDVKVYLVNPEKLAEQKLMLQFEAVQRSRFRVSDVYKLMKSNKEMFETLKKDLHEHFEVSAEEARREVHDKDMKTILGSLYRILTDSPSNYFVQTHKYNDSIVLYSTFASAFERQVNYTPMKYIKSLQDENNSEQSARFATHHAHSQKTKVFKKQFEIDLQKLAIVMQSENGTTDRLVQKMSTTIFSRAEDVVNGLYDQVNKCEIHYILKTK